MARKIRSSLLDTRSARLRLPVRRKPYVQRIANGLRLAYRRNQSGGVWSLLKSNGLGGGWLQKFALADDHEDSNHTTILDYWEACEKARELARGDDPAAESGRLATVAEAVDAFERDLAARDGRIGNVKWLRFHLSPVTMRKPVSLLTVKEVRAIRDQLFYKGLTRASANRFMKAFAACLTLAANLDDRITNRAAWKLKALPDATKARNVILTDAQVRDAVAACYATGGDRFGIFMEVLATTGTRPIQARRLTVGDLEADHASGPRLQMPSSKKGKGRKKIARTALPIPAGLAVRLKAKAAGRADHEPLLRNDAGAAWTENGHPRRFATAAVAAELPAGTTVYALRHSSIVRALRGGIPTKVVASSHDTSIAMIEAHYAKYMPGDDIMRSVLLDLDPASAATATVVPLKAA